MYTTSIVLAGLALVSLSQTVMAGPHGSGSGLERRRVRVVHRRHHHRAAMDARDGCDDDEEDQNDAPAELGINLAAIEVPATSISSSTSCTNGNWQCVGSALQVCDHTHWVTMANCTGSGIVCSASGAVGCVWATSSTAPQDADASESSGGLHSVSIPHRPTSSGVAAPSATGATDEDEEDCEEYEDDDDAESTTSGAGAKTTSIPTRTSIVNATQPTVFTTIGQALLAGNGTAGATSNVTDSSAVRTRTKGTKTFGTPASTATPTATSTNDWNATLTDSLTASATSTSKGKGGSVNATATATGNGAGNSTVSVSPLSAYSAPHWVIYSDYWLNQMPSVSDLKSYNRFILAFWMSNSGPVDNAQNWAWMDADYRTGVLKSYHAAGIALMVSAFGSTDAPTTWGYDPVDTATKLAAYVKEYQLDGVDIDYEDMSAMNSNQAEAWLIPFQRELRRLLPSPYIISHAPVAPWFTSANDYESGAYVNIHSQVGAGIDFYNVQFYNQGDGVYCQCESLLFNSGNGWPSTSVMELNSYAKVPLDKIVIGKPLNAGDASNGYMSASDLAQCVQQAQAKGWNAGVMFWEWTSQAPHVMATVRG